ncbi:uncharacterized protein LOC126622952 [Malus sylvestris]|uniref:uncharacterized protein LOC126622952 n=1 Tax=Malus sylvestris TaxID=3752 RepID=UPI0021ABDAE8|nr:uncharacterized protein LOC126622952 [Malus sylvestris]
MVVLQELKLWLSIEKQEITIEKAMRNKRKFITIVKGLHLFGDPGFLFFGAFVCSLRSCLCSHSMIAVVSFPFKDSFFPVFRDYEVISLLNLGLGMYDCNAFDTCIKEGATTLMELLWHDGDYLATSANLATQPLKYKAEDERNQMS